MVLFDEWFEWLGVLGLCSVCSTVGQPLCRSICLHDCLVVNRTSKSIIYIYTFTARLPGC